MSLEVLLGRIAYRTHRVHRCGHFAAVQARAGTDRQTDRRTDGRTPDRCIDPAGIVRRQLKIRHMLQGGAELTI